MPPPVTYALLAGCLALLVVGFWLEARKPPAKEGSRFARYQRFAWVLQIGAVALAYFVLRPGKSPSDAAAQLTEARAARTPVFIDFYSNY